MYIAVVYCCGGWRKSRLSWSCLNVRCSTRPDRCSAGEGPPKKPAPDKADGCNLPQLRMSPNGELLVAVQIDRLSFSATVSKAIIAVVVFRFIVMDPLTSRPNLSLAGKVTWMVMD